MKARAKIEQAKGMLMMLRGIDANAAFEVLVAQSQRKNTRLAVVASELIESVTERGGIETCTPIEYSTYSAAVVGITRRAVAGQQWPPFGVHSHG